jgi:hypothetical protein
MTQQVKLDEKSWQMNDDDHHLWSGGLGGARLKLWRVPNGEVDIFATETGKRSKTTFIHLNSDTVRSLIEFLNRTPAVNEFVPRKHDAVFGYEPDQANE